MRINGDPETKVTNQLLDLPREIILDIIREVGPADLAPLSRACKALSGLIDENYLLYKEVYLKNYDDGPSLPQGCGPFWKERLRSVVSLLKLLECENVAAKEGDFLEAACTMTLFVKSACSYSIEPSRNIGLLSSYFQPFPRSDLPNYPEHIKQNVLNLLCRSSIFARACGEQDAHRPLPRKQESAKLHCLYGVFVDDRVSGFVSPVVGHSYSYRVSFPSQSSSAMESCMALRGEGTEDRGGYGGVNHR